MIATTAQILVTATLKLIGVLAAEETPSAVELSDGMAALNGMIDNWGTSRPTMLAVARYEFPLVSNQQSYTIGDGGDFDLEPPLAIDQVGLIYPGTTPPNEQPLPILTDDAYASIVLKTMENPLPTYAYYNRVSATIGTLYFWPGPDQDLTIALYVPVTLTQFSGPYEEVTLAAGYYDAMHYNLALRLAPAYQIPVRPDVLELARNSLADMKRANFRPSDLTLDPALMGSRRPYNIYSDT